MSSKPEISIMQREDLRLVLDWAADEGWNPGRKDAGAFLAADPGGFFIARIKGKPVAAISVVNHATDHAFLGLYICHPDWRGQGIGYATWTHALNNAGTRCVGLDGVAEQEPNYRKSGFIRTGASQRFEGRWPPAHSSNIRTARTDDLSRLVEMDAAAGGFARPRFLAEWFDDKGQSRATCILIKDGNPAALATWRTCREGIKIGPLIAENLSDAIELIADIAAKHPKEKLIIDLPEANQDLRRELESAGFEMTFATARMYRGTPPKTTTELQAIATMELG